MTMHPRENAHMMPGCLVWMLLAALVIWTGGWIDGIPIARNHPVLAGIFVVAFVATAAWRATQSERWLPAFFGMLLLNVITTAMLLFFVFAIDHLQGYRFTVLGRE